MEITARKTNRYIWPDHVKRLVRKAAGCKDKPPNAVLLHNQIEELTGFKSDVCWRFLQRHGIQRPGAGTYRTWDETMVNTVVEYVMEHGYKAAAQRFGCSNHAIYSVMKRSGRLAGHSAGQYGLNQLRRLLNVRVEIIREWIDIGLLEATQVLYGGKLTFVVSDDQLRRFLSREAGNMLPRRFPEKRVAFLSNYLYDEKHMKLGLLRTRESRKEAKAFEKKEYSPESRPALLENSR